MYLPSAKAEETEENCVMKITEFASYSKYYLGDEIKERRGGREVQRVQGV